MPIHFLAGFRLMTFCYLAALNCWLLLCPAILSHDWQMGSVPLVTSFTDTRNLATCIFFGGCLVLTYKAFTDFEVSAREETWRCRIEKTERRAALRSDEGAFGCG